MGNWFSKITQSPHFWEGAFIFAIILLIFAHKVTLEGLVET
jgi:hypothetical protein